MVANSLPLQAHIPGPPAPGEVFEWPLQAMRERNWPEAIRRWAVLRKAYPEHPATWIRGAIAHMEANDLETAEALLNYARQHFPNNPNALIHSAELAMRRDEWTRVETFLSQAREEFPDVLEIWIKSSQCAAWQGDQEQALAYNDIARQRFSDRPNAFVQYAELAMGVEDWESALDRWRTVRSRFPKLPSGYLRAAEAARRLNRTSEARELVLAHQYGDDIFDDEGRITGIPGQSGKDRRLGRLLELIWTKAVFNLRSEVHRNYLSYAWWVVEPLLHMMVYYLVFGLLLQRGGENFTVFLLTGLIPWMWLSKGISGSSSSIIQNQRLMIQVGLPAIVFPLVSQLQTTLKQLPVFGLLLGFLWLQGFTPGQHWWGLLPVILVHVLLMIALACTVAAVIPFVRDLAYLVPTGLMFVMFFSGVIFDYRTIPEQWQELFLLNPVAFLLKCYREVLVEGVTPDMHTLSWWALVAVLACVLTMLVYERLRYIYPRIVMQ